jgi:hypothetical protein
MVCTCIWGEKTPQSNITNQALKKKPGIAARILKYPPIIASKINTKY